MKKLILRAFLTFTVISMVLSPVSALDDIPYLQNNENVTVQKEVSNINENDLIDYLYIEEPETTNDYENVVLGLKDKYKNCNNVILSYINSNNESLQVVQTKKVDANILFKIENLTKGTYQLSSIIFEMDDLYYQSTFSTNYNVSFSVNDSANTFSRAKANSTNFSEDTDSMEYTEVNSIDDALKTVSNAKSRNSSGRIVVYLDPGHDNTHSGSRNSSTGVVEETYNLRIAQACRDELQKYQNVTVYLSRSDDGSCPYPGTSSGTCNANRVRDAASKGADIYIALHLNSTGSGITSAHGAEAYVSNYSYFHNDAYQLGTMIIQNLKNLGLSVHGDAVKIRNTEDKNDYYYSDGTIKDYYGIMKEGVYNNVNAMIIEHAFINNYNDANIIKNKTKELGVADAEAIAKYYGLSIGSNISLKGFSWQVLPDRINIGSAYYSNDPNVKFTFKSYNLDTHEWITLGTNKTSNWQTWNPTKGNYWIYCEATTSAGYTDSQVMCFAVGKNYAPYVQLNGFTWQVLPDRINIGSAYSSNDPNVKFTFKSYNLDTHVWTTLSTNKVSNWQTWNPTKGNYWIYCEATTSTGYTTNQVMCFAVGKNYTQNRASSNSLTGVSRTASQNQLSKAYSTSYVRLKGFTWQIQSDKILLGADYDTNDSDVRFTFKSYNLDTNEWKTLDSNKKSNWQTWKPVKGNYWIYCEATTSTGYTTNQVMCFAVGKNYAPYINLKGFTWETQSDKILLGVNYDTNDSGSQFSFKVYNLDTKKWETLSTYKKSNWQTWKPYAGNYWIYCEAKTSTGYTTNQIMCFAVDKNYAPYVDLKGFTWQIESDKILLGTAYDTNDSDVRFTFKSYNLDTKVWETLDSNKKSNWQTWKPERGNYWIYCEAITSNGYIANQTMCFAISEDYSGKLYRIMGDSSITVDQMVAYYQKNNSTYDVYSESQYNGCLTQGGAPDIRTYCQLFLEEARQEGVKVDVAFAQAMLETGFLKFGGDVKPNQYNFAGLGATGGGVHGNSFPDVRTGIRAQIQHLKCYASTDSLNNDKVDPRWNNSLRGKAIYVEYLSIPNNPYNTGWAASATYGQDLLRIITALFKC